MGKNVTSLNVYWGGLFSNSPGPLELSLNYCSHGCVYCFANLNKPDRKANPKQALNLLQDMENRESYAAMLLRERYPVDFSPTVDPFAKSNADIALPLIEMMLAMDVPFSLMTKGGKRVGEAIAMLDKPIYWYISIATLNEEIVRETEPGAPSIKERLALVEKLTNLGHKVAVGINPAVPDWEPEKVVAEVAKRGAVGIRVQPMHISHRQLQNVSAKGKEALGQIVIHQALYRYKHPELYQVCDMVRELSLEAGMEVFDSQQKEQSNFFDNYRACYKKTFPMMQDFVNWCYREKKPGDSIYYEEFRDFFVPLFPQGTFPLYNYVYANTHAASMGGVRIPTGNSSFERYLEIIWDTPEVFDSPVNTECFGYAADWDESNGGGWWHYSDDNGRHILVFRPDGTKGEACVQWSPPAS